MICESDELDDFFGEPPKLVGCGRNHYAHMSCLIQSLVEPIYDDGEIGEFEIQLEDGETKQISIPKYVNCIECNNRALIPVPPSYLQVLTIKDAIHSGIDFPIDSRLYKRLRNLHILIDNECQ